MITTIEEFKIYDKIINEYYGGGSKGQILFVLQDIEKLIKKLSRFGLPANEIENKVLDIIKSNVKNKTNTEILK